MNHNNFCVIMAGGVGTRFWPLSKTARPKQFLDILNTGRTLIQDTVDRFKDICPPENIYIVTNRIYTALVKEQLPLIPEENILLEPQRKNTAPCIAYANARIMRRNPDANIIVAPSDHLITNTSDFRNDILKGLEFVSGNDVLLTIGIRPTRPETGYGYIQVSNEDGASNRVLKVKTFTEKPDINMAKVFVQSGDFYWNSGMFLWNIKAINKAFSVYLQEVDLLFRDASPQIGTSDEPVAIGKVYSECKNISVDYGIMEKAENVYVICSDLGWSDLGTWGSLFENMSKTQNNNVIDGKNVFLYNTDNCIINISGNKLLAVNGLSGYIVVESDNSILICKKEDEQQIRQIVNDILIRKGEGFV